jgi:arylsulfatase A-like enzyme
MQRRNFLNTALGTAFAPRPERPNVIVIMSDEQRWDTIGADGCPWMITPNLDRLAREGVVFGNAHCASPVCVSSRASFQYGLYPPATGVYTNTYRWDGSKDWMWSFRQNGYYCASFGKNHYVPYESSACAWHERVIVENKNGDRNYKDAWDRFLEPRGIPRPPKRFEQIGTKAFRERFGAHTWDWAPETHSDFFVGDRATDWIRKYNRREPFLLWVGFPGPHTPIDPVKKYVDLYASKNPPKAIGGRDELDRKPWEQRQQFEYWHLDNNDDGIWMGDATPEKVARLRRHYYANITMIDEKIGEILAALEAKRVLDNTIVIFTSDHGNMLADHALFVKWSAYEGSVHVPLLVWYPKGFSGGRRTMRVTQTFDVVPALLEEAGCPVPEGRQWQNCARFLRGRQDPEPERKYVYAMVERDRGVWSKRCPSTFVMVRSRDRKFVWYENSASRELYDLRTDPGELANLATDRTHASLCSEFEKEVTRWLAAKPSGLH